MNTRRYERVTPESTETVFVHIDDTGHVKMTAENLHNILTHLGFTTTDIKEPTR